MVLSTFPTCMQQNEQLSHRLRPTRVIWRLFNNFSFRNISRLGQAVLLIKGHPFDRAPVPAAIAFSSLLLYSLTLRKGRAGRATKGALRGAAARAAGTACCALRAEPRMDIAGAAMILVSSTEGDCQECRDVCLQTKCAACRSVDQSHEACTLDGQQQKGIRISKPPRDVSTLGLRLRSHDRPSASRIWCFANSMVKEAYEWLTSIGNPFFRVHPIAIGLADVLADAVWPVGGRLG